MAAEVTGIGFRTADRVGLGLGADPADPSRLEAAVLQSLRDAAAEAGHTVVERPAITAAAATLTGRPMAEAQAAVDRLVAAGKVVATERPAGLALARLAAAERFTALRLRVMAAWPDPAPLAIDDAEIDGFAYAEGVPFDESQRRAIRGALVHRVSVITGNPGTGKTTIVRALLEAAERRGLRVALVSPTGRAAKRLEEATGRPASTIHRYLGFRPDGPWDGPAELPDLLVVDESSMLDVRLAARLLEPLLPWTRLCFVGDIDQLPAVGPGNVLADLVRSPLVGVFRLTTIHRTEGGSAVPKLAAQIRAGVRAPVFTPPTTRFIPAESADEVAAEIEAVVARAGDRRLEIVVIAPSRRGPCGVEALNRRLAPIFNPDAGQPALPRRGEEPPLRSGDRIVVDGNHYGHGLFNGDIVEATEAGPQRVVIRLGDGSERVLRPAEALELLEPAWAMTVHRAQGSEFPVVVIPLHASAYMLLERRLFYTAVSRASSAVVVVGQPKAMAIAAGRFDPAGRRTLLRGLLAEPEPPALLLRDLDDEQEAMVAVAAAAAPAPTIAGVAVDEDDDIF
jgi:exodeoxyribonuclease V alpha subunit